MPLLWAVVTAVFQFALVLLAVSALVAAPPPGYYDSAQGKTGAELRSALHAIIQNHHVVPYSSTRFDTSDALKVLDADPADTNLVILIYSGSNALSSTFGLTTGWNREHLWPNSYGLDDVEPAFSDLHNLRACDANVNSARGNKFFAVSDPGRPGYRNPAHVEASLSTTDSDSWEPPLAQRGNIARALFYMVTRYIGDSANEPALTLTDDVARIQSTNTFMGKLSTLLKWHQADPVDAIEQLRNDRVYLIQTNRNPYVDHPEWAALAFWPTLRIERGTPGVRAFWPGEFTDAILEWSETLPGSWNAVTNAPTPIGGGVGVLLPDMATVRFYRLRLQ